MFTLVETTLPTWHNWTITLTNTILKCTRETTTTFNSVLCYTTNSRFLFLGKRRGILVLNDLLETVKTIELNDACVAMTSAKNVLLIATYKDYRLVTSSLTVPLFNYQQSPIVAQGLNEFVLFNQVCVFIDYKGFPTRDTLSLRHTPTSLLIIHPYLLALSNTLDIYFIPTNTLIQSIVLDQYKNCMYLDPIHHSTGLLKPTLSPISNQIDFLFLNHFVKQAVILAELYNHDLTSVYQRAGFYFWNSTLFDESIDYFSKCKLDYMTLVDYFPDLNLIDRVQESETISSLITNALDRDYPDADKSTLSSFQNELIVNAKSALLKYLVTMQQDVYIQKLLFQLYASCDSDKIYALVDVVDLDFMFIENVLKVNSLWDLLSRFCIRFGFVEQALDIWVDLLWYVVISKDRRS